MQVRKEIKKQAKLGAVQSMRLLEVCHSVLLLRTKLSECCMNERSCANRASDFHK